MIHYHLLFYTHCDMIMRENVMNVTKMLGLVDLSRLFWQRMVEDLYKAAILLSGYFT